MSYSFGICLVVLALVAIQPVHLGVPQRFTSPDLTGPELFGGGICPLGYVPYLALIRISDDYSSSKIYDTPYSDSYDSHNYHKNDYSYNHEKITFCVGIIFNDQHILVPANCTITPAGKARPLSSYTIRVGMGSLNDDPNPQSVTYNVSEVIVDPDYQIAQTSPDNNLAFLKTSCPIVYTPYVKRACIDTSTTRFPELYTQAYGRIPELDPRRNYCKVAFTEESLRSSCEDEEICAYPSTDPGQLLSCPAHYGGILQTFKFDVVGLLAPSPTGVDSCQRRDTYIRLSSYVDFFNDVLGKRGWCKLRPT